MNRARLQQLSLLRLEEARLLLDRGSPSGAYYLAGYCVECALKAVISRETQQYDFPENRINESFTHDLKKLRKIACLDERFEDDSKRIPGLGANWTVVCDWSEQSRYSEYNMDLATELVAAVGNASEGVLTWIMRYW